MSRSKRWTTPLRQKIEVLQARLVGLANDARYCALCRTYGDYSAQVLRHLESCAETQLRTERVDE